jgi:hypothetical protein
MTENGTPGRLAEIQRRRARTRLLRAVLAVLGLLAAGALVYLLALAPEQEPAPQEQAAEEAERAGVPPPRPLAREPELGRRAEPRAEPPEEAAPPAPARELPPLDESDSLVRELVGGLSSHAALARWLVTDDLIRRFTVSVANVAEGRSPREHALALEPEGRFRAERREAALVVDPRSYERYDLIAEVVDGIDAEAAVRLYRELEPLFDRAYADLGHPDGDFDDAIARALDELLATPRVEGPIELVPEDGRYLFRDPDLEALGAAQKQLLRMGPENGRIVRRKLRALADALGIPRSALPEPRTLRPETG